MAKREPMVHLYYASKRECREDCDTLGIDRRRVTSIRSGFDVLAGFDNGEPVFKPAVAKLVVRESLVQQHLESLQHNDDCTMCRSGSGF
jgi:hypothetical protein